MDVVDSSLRQPVAEVFATELGVAPRTREGADVGHHGDVLGKQDVEQLLARTRRVPDGVRDVQYGSLPPPRHDANCTRIEDGTLLPDKTQV